MAMTVDELDRGQLDLMWNFLKMGNGKPNIKVLEEHCDMLRQLMIQNTAGQKKYKKPYEVELKSIGTIVNCIVIETMQIYLSGGLKKLEELQKLESEGNNG